MAADKITDSEQCGLWLDPVIREAIDNARGKKSRPYFILETVGKALKLEGYEPRGKGKPKKPIEPPAPKKRTKPGK